MNCPICDTEFESHTGRRPKKFCSPACKTKFWNEQKKEAANKSEVTNKPENKAKDLNKPSGGITKDLTKPTNNINPPENAYLQSRRDLKTGKK